MATVIAIDHGNSAIKTVNHLFTSGVTQHLAKPPLADELIEYQGSFWTLTSNRIAYKRNKTKDEQFFILSLFAIAKELKLRGEHSPLLNTVTLAVGLPPEHYGKGMSDFAAYFKRDGVVQFMYNGTPFAIQIERVFVYPQAFAATANIAATIKSQDRMFVVDIGGMTTDVLLLRKGVPDLSFCRSLECGIITMQNTLIGKINAEYDMTLEDEHIMAVLQGRETILPEDVRKSIHAASLQHAESILDKLRELGVDLRSNPAIFTGGGALLLRSFIEQSKLVTSAQFIESPNANAVGYEMMANGQLRRAN